LKLSWHYGEDGEHPASPVSEATVYDPEMKTKLAIRATVDTGFSGTVLITPEQYIGLGLQSFEEPERSYAGRGATGAIVPIVASRGMIRLGSQTLECAVYSSRILFKPLVGRELLNRWEVLLSGPQKRLQITF
jgi:predicted aspartyl protease